ncbi:hypothetical protein A9Q89_11800 [Gammaproteobacteria bacterium 53_120_T64]|nr:hypothetical protein A9Q89_11800 [Gammaproteobacteria bacterium 53_120_T64]
MLRIGLFIATIVALPKRQAETQAQRPSQIPDTMTLLRLPAGWKEHVSKLLMPQPALEECIDALRRGI